MTKDKSDKDAFKTAFHGFAARPPVQQQGAGAGPTLPGGARDLSPSGATDGSARQADENPPLSRREEAEARKANEKVVQELRNVFPGHQQAGPAKKPNVAEQGAVGQAKGAHTQSQTQHPTPPGLRLDIAEIYQEKWKAETENRRMDAEDGRDPEFMPPKTIAEGYQSHVETANRKDHKNANPVADITWCIFRDVLGEPTAQYQSATGRKVRPFTSAVKGWSDSARIPVERDPRNSLTREHGIMGPSEGGEDWLIAGPEEFPRFSWLSPTRSGTREIESEFAAHMPEWCKDWNMSMKVFMEKKKRADVPLILSTVFLGGAKDELELFNALGYPIDMSSEVVGQNNWSFRTCTEAAMNETRTVRNGAGVIHWLCQPVGGRSTTWNGGNSGPPVVATLGTTNKLARYQAMKAYVIRACMEFPELTACERKFIKMTTRPRLSIGPNNPGARNELRSWQLIGPTFMWAPQTRMSSVIKDMKDRGFLWEAGFVKFIDVVKSTKFIQFMRGYDEAFVPREDGKAKYYFLTPAGVCEEDPADDAPDHCGYEFIVQWTANSPAGPLSQEALQRKQVEENGSNGPPTRAHTQSLTPPAFTPTHTMPQELQKNHTIGGEGRYRYNGDIFRPWGLVNADDGWKERRDAARKDENGQIVHTEISIAGGFRCIATMAPDAIPHFFKGWSTIAQSMVNKEKEEQTVFSSRMTNNQTVQHRQRAVRNLGDPGKQLFPTMLPGDTYVQQMAYHDAARHATKLSGEKPKKLRRQEDRIPIYARGKPVPTESQILEMESGSKNPWDVIGVTYAFPDEEGTLVSRPMSGTTAAHRALCLQYVARTSGLSTVPFVFMDARGGTVDGVYMQVLHSNTTPNEVTQVGFTGVSTGMIFVGWTTPATRDSSVMSSYAEQGKSLAPTFDAYTAVGCPGPLTPDMLVSDLRPARLSSATTDILSSIFGQFLTHPTGSWRANLRNKGIEYWGNAGRLEEGSLSMFGSLDLPWTAEWRCASQHASAMNIPESIQPVYLIDEALLTYRSGDDPRTIYPREHPVVEHTVVDVSAPRNMAPNSSTTAKQGQVWQHNEKRLWGINVERASKAPTAPTHVVELGKVATCKRTGPGGRYHFELNKHDYTMSEINEHERMLYATHPVARPIDSDLSGFEELEAMQSVSESAYAIFVQDFLRSASEFCQRREINGVVKRFANPVYDPLPIIDVVHGPGFAEIRPVRIYKDLEFVNSKSIPPDFLCPLLPAKHVVHFIKTNKFLRDFLRNVYPGSEPIIPAAVMGQVCELPTILSAINAESLLTPMSIATEWEGLKATLLTLQARHPVAATRESLGTVYDFMVELQKHPGTFMYMRTYEQQEPQKLVEQLSQMLPNEDNEIERLRQMSSNHQLAVWSAKDKGSIIHAATPHAMIQSMKLAPKGSSTMFVNHWKMADLLSLLNEDDEDVSSVDDDEIAPNSRQFYIDGRGLILCGQHKLGANGAREVDRSDAKFPGLSHLREAHDLNCRDVHKYATVLVEYLQPFLNYLASEVRQATVMEGLVPTITNRDPASMAVRNAKELINERCAVATHLVLCSGDVWSSERTDVLSTAWRKGTMFGCNTPDVPRTAIDMPLEDAYTAMLSKEMKSFTMFLASLHKRPEQTGEMTAIEDEAF